MVPSASHTQNVSFLTVEIKKKFLFIYFWLHWVFSAVSNLSLVAVSGGYSLVVLRGLLIAKASLVAEPGI